MTNIDWMNNLPESARLVKAYGTESKESLSDEVADMPEERKRAFVVELAAMDEAARNQIIEDEELGL